jgi:transposase-like protein
MAHLKTTELAEQFGIPQSTLRWWRHRGKARAPSNLGGQCSTTTPTWRRG